MVDETEVHKKTRHRFNVTSFEGNMRDRVCADDGIRTLDTNI